MQKSVAHKTLLLAACAMLIATPAFAATSSLSMAGDDHFVIIAQGVPGAPQGGSTGTGGNAGVGDHNAGTDRANTYDTPNAGSGTSSPSEPAEKLNNNPVNSTTSGAMNSTTSGTQRSHHHHGTKGSDSTNGMNNDSSGDSGAGNGTPKSGNSY